MQSHPDLMCVLAHDHASRLRTTLSRTRRTEPSVHLASWRRIAGTAMVRLGEVILGDIDHGPIHPAVSTR